MTIAVLRAVIEAPTPDLLDEWDDLADRCEVAPFARPGWIAALAGAFGGSLRLVAVRRGGELVAVAPFLAGRARTTPTNWHSPWFEIAAVDGEARRAAWSAMIDAPAVSIDHVLEGSDDAAAIDDVLAARGGRVAVRERQRPPYLDLGHGWEQMEAAMSSNLRGDTRRRARRLAERGEVAFEVITEPSDLDAALDEGFAVEGSGWKTRAGTAVSSDGHTERFYRAIAAWAAPRGMLRLCFLRVDGAPVAFDLSLEAGGRHYLLKTGYDEEWSKLSPGKVLRREVIRHCVESGVSTYEFTGDATPWKLAWTDDARRTVRYEAFAPSMSGAAAWFGRRVARAAAALGRRVRRA